MQQAACKAQGTISYSTSPSDLLSVYPIQSTELELIWWLFSVQFDGKWPENRKEGGLHITGYEADNTQTTSSSRRCFLSDEASRKGSSFFFPFLSSGIADCRYMCYNYAYST